jgi:hypothetical protein
LKTSISIAERAYELRAIDTSLPFADLRRLSYIDERARAADCDPTFSRRIREGLPEIHDAWITRCSSSIHRPEVCRPKISRTSNE